MRGTGIKESGTQMGLVIQRERKQKNLHNMLYRKHASFVETNPNMIWLCWARRLKWEQKTGLVINKQANNRKITETCTIYCAESRTSFVDINPRWSTSKYRLKQKRKPENPCMPIHVHKEVSLANTWWIYWPYAYIFTFFLLVSVTHCILFPAVLFVFVSSCLVCRSTCKVWCAQLVQLRH